MKEDNVTKSFGVLFIYLIINSVLSSYYDRFQFTNGLLNNILMTVIQIICLIVVIYFLNPNLKDALKDFKTNIKKYISIILKYWIPAFILMLVVNFVINYLILGEIAPNESANREILSEFPIYSIMYMCLIGPFTEELLFRLNFKGVLKSKAAYILMTSLLFGLLHVLGSLTGIKDLLYLIPYSLLGAGFGLIYYETKNIFTSTLAHIIHNSLTIAIILLGI